LARHELAYSAVLAVAGGVIGLAVAGAALPVVVAFGPADLPGLEHVRLDARVAVFVLLATLLTAALVATAPAWLASRLAIAASLKAGAGHATSDGGGGTLGRLLVVAEVAISVVLLAGCGLIVRSLGNLMGMDLGFVPEHTLSFGVATSRPEGKQDLPRLLLPRLRALPDVAAAGAVSLRPLHHGVIGSDNWVTVEGQPLDLASVRDHSLAVNHEVATPGYLRAIGTRLLRGRDFTEDDREDTPMVAIVSESLARRAWPGEDALGKRLHTWPAKSTLKDGVFVDVEWQTVVGIVQDARYRGIQVPRLDVYLPHAQGGRGAGHYVLRTKGDPLAVVGAVRTQVQAIDPDAALDGLTTMTSLVAGALSPWRFTSGLLGAFAAAGLLLTATGLFAVLQHFVGGRTREIAIRMACGAEAGQVQRAVMARGMALTAIGLGIGLAASLCLAGTLAVLLHDVGPADPWSHLAAAAALLIVAAVACRRPAARAATVDPTAALRAE
jgi:putative ABC transport system permease protein